MEYTKGEWKVTDYGDGLWVIRGNLKLIALSSAPLKPDEVGESQANACLIAQAPKMYEALKFLTTGKREDGNYDKYDASGFIKIAEDAISELV